MLVRPVYALLSALWLEVAFLPASIQYQKKSNLLNIYTIIAVLWQNLSMHLTFDA